MSSKKLAAAAVSIIILLWGGVMSGEKDQPRGDFLQPGLSGRQNISTTGLLAGEATVTERILPLTMELEYEIGEEEIIKGQYYRLVDEKDKLITETGRRVRVGDLYLDSDNRLYEVYRVEGYMARARYIRTERLQPPEIPGAAPPSLTKDQLGENSPLFPVPGQSVPAQEERKLVAIYHTHNAESYVPSDGTHSIYGKGGVHRVGSAFKEALEEKGVDVIHAENLHLPHDRGAYRRSRDTVLELLKHGPDVIFDIHRDAAPMDAYAVQIEEDWVTQVQFVVGRQNLSVAVTRSFAYDLKALADDIYPGLVKGVFMGWGNYNQDLTPLKLLLEAGGHQNSREAAKEGMTFFADVVAYYFYAIPPENGAGSGAIVEREGEEEIARAAWGTLAGVIIFLTAVLGAFYVLNNPDRWIQFKREVILYIGKEGMVWKHGFANLQALRKDFLSLMKNTFLFLKKLLAVFGK